MYKGLVGFITNYRNKRNRKNYPVIISSKKKRYYNEVIINCGRAPKDSQVISSRIRADTEFNRFLKENNAVCGLMQVKNYLDQMVWRLWVRW